MQASGWNRETGFKNGRDARQKDRTALDHTQARHLKSKLERLALCSVVIVKEESVVDEECALLVEPSLGVEAHPQASARGQHCLD